MGPKVYLVNYPNQADYKVCFVNSDSQQKNHSILLGGKLVKYPNQADHKLFIVKYPNHADILITHKNFPK